MTRSTLPHFCCVFMYSWWEDRFRGHSQRYLAVTELRSPEEPAFCPADVHRTWSLWFLSLGGRPRSQSPHLCSFGYPSGNTYRYCKQPASDGLSQILKEDRT